nr:hypothetical protein CFP56_09891 [Quercus suber]
MRLSPCAVTVRCLILSEQWRASADVFSERGTELISDLGKKASQRAPQATPYHLCAPDHRMQSMYTWSSGTLRELGMFGDERNTRISESFADGVMSRPFGHARIADADATGRPYRAQPEIFFPNQAAAAAESPTRQAGSLASMLILMIEDGEDRCPARRCWWMAESDNETRKLANAEQPGRVNPFTVKSKKKYSTVYGHRSASGRPPGRRCLGDPCIKRFAWYRAEQSENVPYPRIIITDGFNSRQKVLTKRNKVTRSSGLEPPRTKIRDALWLAWSLLNGPAGRLLFYTNGAFRRQKRPPMRSFKQHGSCSANRNTTCVLLLAFASLSPWYRPTSF